jgi:uncharacterized protein involved in outer membrane biogenesis
VATRQRWLLVMAIGIVLVVAAPLIVPIPIPLQFAREHIAAAASDALGHPVQIDSVRLTTGLTPALRLSGVRVSDAPALDAHAQRIEADFPLLPLASGELRLRTVRVDAARIEFGTAAPGDAPVAPRSGGSRFRVTGPDQVTIRNSAVSFPVAGMDAPLRVAIDEGSAASAPGGKIGVDAKGSVQGLAATLKLETASVAQWLQAKAPLPLDATITLPEARAAAIGTWDAAISEFAGTIAIDAVRPTELAAAFGIERAPTGVLHLSSELRAKPDRVTAQNVRFRLGLSELSGTVSWDATGARPRLTVNAHASTLDHASLPKVSGKGVMLPDWIATSLRLPTQGDATIDATVDRLLTPLFEARDGTLATRVENGVLNSSLTASIDGSPLKSETRIDANGPAPVVSIRVKASAVPLKQLLQRLGQPQLTAIADTLSITLDARGADAKALVDGFRMSAKAEPLRVSEGKREVARLRLLRLDAAGTGASRLRADGRLWGDPFTVNASTEHLGDLLDGTPSPVRFDLVLASARASGSGELSDGPDGAVGRLTVQAGARPLGPLHRLLPVDPASALNAQIAGSVELRPGAAEIRADTLRLGASAGKGTVALPRAGNAGPLRVDLAFEKLDLAQLQRAYAAVPEGGKKAALPPDTRFDVTARRVQYGKRGFDEARANGELRGGQITGAAFFARLGGTRIEGTAGLDLREAATGIRVDAAASPVDLGAVLALAGADGITGNAGRMAVKVSLRGATAGALLRSASGEFSIERGSVALPKLFTARTMAFSATARIAPGDALTATLEGTAGDAAVQASARIDDPATLLGGDQPPAFSAKLSGAGAAVELSGEWGSRRSARLEVRGRTATELRALLAIPLPTVGSYGVDADLTWRDQGVEAKKIALTLEQSRADGNFTLDWRGARPRLDLRLTSPRLRIEDIGIGDAMRNDTGAIKRASQLSPAERSARLEAAGDWLRAFDGSVRIEAKRVESAGQLLGRGIYQERRQNGRMTLAPLEVESEGARLTVNGTVTAGNADLSYALNATLENFDLGPLARSIDPGGGNFGILDARANLTSRGLPLEFLANASGTLDAMFIARDLGSGALGLWGTGVLNIIGETLSQSEGGRVNCAVGDFAFTDGAMQSKAFFIDTTSTRVAGDLQANFRTGAISGTLQPEAKRPQLFAAVTPLIISGTLEDPRVAVSPVGLATGTLRLYLFAPALAVDWLTARGLPADGTPGCRDAYKKLGN